MIAADLKTAAMRYLRFEKQLFMLATECGAYSADVLGANETRMIEVETKVSMTDFRADFKKPKHVRYAEAMARESPMAHWDHVPNYFYFCVPKDLEANAVPLLKGSGRPYGLLVAELRVDFSIGEDRWHWPYIDLRCAIPARRLHKAPPSDSALKSMARRMSTELVMHTQLAAAQREMSKTVAAAADAFVRAEAEKRKWR